jgi:mycoredoxin
MSEIKVYGADWCSMTRRTLEHLNSIGVGYDYIDIEQDPAAREWVKKQNDGKERKPTVKIQDRVIAEPSAKDLDQELAAAGLL